MNIVAVFSDIYANLPALEAVLADMDARGLEERYCLGDLQVALVHGSSRRVNEYLYEDRPDSSLERLLDMVEADVML